MRMRWGSPGRGGAVGGGGDWDALNALLKHDRDPRDSGGICLF